MKKIIGVVLLLPVIMAFSWGGFTSGRQEESTGIAFKHISLTEAKKLAKKSDKLIFIDAYTSWCGPCKRMAATTFKNSDVAEYFNKNFVNLKIDVEKDADGPELARMYKIQAYPTLLFIDGDGKMHKSVLGFQEPDKLLAIGKSVN